MCYKLFVIVKRGPGTKMFENHQNKALLISFQRSSNSMHIYSLLLEAYYSERFPPHFHSSRSTLFDFFFYQLSFHSVPHTFILMTHTLILISILPENLSILCVSNFLPPIHSLTYSNMASTPTTLLKLLSLTVLNQYLFVLKFDLTSMLTVS